VSIIHPLATSATTTTTAIHELLEVVDKSFLLSVVFGCIKDTE
jgi:hypothetical protein